MSAAWPNEALEVALAALPYPSDCITDAGIAIVERDIVSYREARAQFQAQLSPLKRSEVALGSGRSRMDVSLGHHESAMTNILNIIYMQGVPSLAGRQAGYLVDVLCQQIEKGLEGKVSPEEQTRRLVENWVKYAYRIKCNGDESKNTPVKTAKENLRLLSGNINLWRAERSAGKISIAGLGTPKEWREFNDFASRRLEL